MKFYGEKQVFEFWRWSLLIRYEVWETNKCQGIYLTNNSKNYSFTDIGKTLEGQVSSEGLVLQG